jgi:predicted RNase H-like HicB family nuclease
MTNKEIKKEDMRYKVYLRQSEEGCAVWCPSLPGCCSQGETAAEALENIKDAISSYLEVLEELNQEGEYYYVEVGEQSYA